MLTYELAELPWCTFLFVHDDPLPSKRANDTAVGVSFIRQAGYNDSNFGLVNGTFGVGIFLELFMTVCLRLFSILFHCKRSVRNTLF